MYNLTCHECGGAFRAVRSHAKHCAPRCRKTASRKAKPDATQNRTSSPTQRRREDEFFDLHMVLSEAYFRTPPEMRPAFLESLIDRARFGDAKISRVLTNLHLLTVREPTRVTNFLGRSTLAQEAHRFTSQNWGVHIKVACSG